MVHPGVLLHRGCLPHGESIVHAPARADPGRQQLASAGNRAQRVHGQIVRVRVRGIRRHDPRVRRISKISRAARLLAPRRVRGGARAKQQQVLGYDIARFAERRVVRRRAIVESTFVVVISQRFVVVERRLLYAAFFATVDESSRRRIFRVESFPQRRRARFRRSCCGGDVDDRECHVVVAPQLLQRRAFRPDAEALVRERLGGGKEDVHRVAAIAQRFHDASRERTVRAVERARRAREQHRHARGRR